MSDNLWDAKRCADFLGYPEVPPAAVDAHADGLGLPAESGIYFLWDGDTVVYVGRTSRLAGRVRLGWHHILKPSYRVSWVTVHPDDIMYAECFYIGLLRPRRNFDSFKAHGQERRSWKVEK